MSVCLWVCVCVKLLAKTFKRDFRLWRVRRCMTTICFHLCKPHSLSLSRRQVLCPVYLFGRPKCAACRINHVVCIFYAFILNAAVAALVNYMNPWPFVWLFTHITAIVAWISALTITVQCHQCLSSVAQHWRSSHARTTQLLHNTTHIHRK